MSIIITVKDKNNNTLLFGQLYDYSVHANGDMNFTLTKIHAPAFSEEEFTWDGFKVPCENCCHDPK